MNILAKFMLCKILFSLLREMVGCGSQSMEMIHFSKCLLINCPAEVHLIIVSMTSFQRIMIIEASGSAILLLFLSTLGNASDSWFLNWPFWAGNSPHSFPSHVHVPPQKSVCDKMMSWLEMLGHNNSYSCQPLPSDIHGMY